VDSHFHPDLNVKVRDIKWFRLQGLLGVYYAIVGPANQSVCIILCVGNLAAEKF
jgi:hypothetical protein